MQPLLAIAWLTLKAALRYRLVLVLTLLLLGSVVALPLVIKDDGTAGGFTQILLTYTLTAITALMGLATLWLACSTLAREVEDCQIQMVAVKPVARWQIWLGKWLGILILNALLLGISGTSVYFLMLWRAQKLPPEERTVLKNEILVARGSLKPPVPIAVIEIQTDRMLEEKLTEAGVDTSVDRQLLRDQIRERIKQTYQLVPPGFLRIWKIDLGLKQQRLRDQPLYLRVKFASAQQSVSGTFNTLWEVGVPESARIWRTQRSMAPDSFYHLELPPNLFDENGVLTVQFINPNDTALVFLIEDGIELLYREGGFGLNFFRGLCIIFFWLAMLAAIGLVAASFLSFTVAAFLSLAVLMIGLSTGTMKQVVEEGGIMGVNHETGYTETPTLVDKLAVPFFQTLLKLVNLVRDFSPIDSLSTGRSISWGELGRAFAQICLLMAGLLSAIGIAIFTRRELAIAQTHQ